ncbi:MAG: hypothetical protein QF903_07660 [Planctomycetota bacterium]|jgi:hypothetical protein|nr:hypothetical protein [Planctomycetota bacterium]MDP6762240.1 hypothetical protein [Planctomycetota bacterium]MDP6989341.1 hypothetical protein [Planctomycetota bacterium]
MSRIALCALAVLVSGAEPVEVEARVRATYLVVSLELEGFEEDRELARRAEAGLGDRAVLFGTFLGGRASLAIIAEPSPDPTATSASWRSRLCEHEEGFFTVGSFSCQETRETIGGEEQVEFRAFPLAAGYCFDVRVRWASEERERLSREAFVELIDTFRVALLRRGWRSDYPAAVLARMNEAASRGPAARDWLRARAAAVPDDYTAPFVLAEILETSGGGFEPTRTAYEHALSSLAALEAPTPAERFATAVGEDGLGLTLAKAGRLTEALEHYRGGYEIALELGHVVRAPLAYNLACAAALSGERAIALDFLERAARLVPRYRAMAQSDADFVSLRADSEFRRIVSAGR